MIKWIHNVLASPEEKSEQKLKDIANKFIDFSSEQAGGYFSNVIPAMTYLLSILEVIQNENGEFTKLHQMETVRGMVSRMATINCYLNSEPYIYCSMLCRDPLADKILASIGEAKQRAFLGGVIIYSTLHDEMSEILETITHSLSAAGKLAEQQYEQVQTEIYFQQAKLLRHFIDIDKSKFLELCMQAQEINDSGQS